MRSIRVRVVRQPALLTKVLQIFLRVVFAYQRRRARALGIAEPQTGAVSFIQLWGSVLQLTPHAHSYGLGTVEWTPNIGQNCPWRGH